MFHRPLQMSALQVMRAENLLYVSLGSTAFQELFGHLVPCFQLLSTAASTQCLVFAYGTYDAATFLPAKGGNFVEQ